jgi:putative transposase
LVAVIDWYSRYVMAWELSNSLDTSFCIEAFERAAERTHPEILNTDQGVQFTSHDFVDNVLDKQIRVSMDGRGRAYDNIFVERLWRTVKYEEVYLKAYENGHDAFSNLEAYFRFYNDERPHQALHYQTPKEVYEGTASLQVDEVMISERPATAQDGG